MKSDECLFALPTQMGRVDIVRVNAGVDIYVGVQGRRAGLGCLNMLSLPFRCRAARRDNHQAILLLRARAVCRSWRSCCANATKPATAA